MNLVHHILEILTLEISQYLHSCALHFLYVPDCRCGAIMNRHDAVHQVDETLLVIGVDLLHELVYFEDAIVDDLDAVV